MEYPVKKNEKLIARQIDKEIELQLRRSREFQKLESQLSQQIDEESELPATVIASDALAIVVERPDGFTKLMVKRTVEQDTSIRSRPDAFDSKPIDDLKKDSVITALGENEEWYYIEHVKEGKTIKGYVLKDKFITMRGGPGEGGEGEDLRADGGAAVRSVWHQYFSVP